MKNTKIDSWREAWGKADKEPASKLYTGRAFQESIEAIQSGPKPWCVYIVSAGGGLIRGPSSDERGEQDVPGYEVHCFPGKPMTPVEMGKLWQKGKYPECPKETWPKMEIKSSDELVICLSNAYQQAVLNADFITQIPKDVQIYTIGSSANKEVKSEKIGAERGMREALGCGFTMLRATILCRWLADTLPKPKTPKPRKARRVSDDELMKLVQAAPTELRTSISAMVKHLRHTEKIAASYERIRTCIFSIRNVKQ